MSAIRQRKKGESDIKMDITHVDDLIWTPVRTKPRQEKKLQEYCNANHVLNYLPLLKKCHRYERRTVEFHVPMFPGYIFCHIDEEKYKRILRSNAIVFRISLNDKQELDLVQELKSIQIYERMSVEKEIVVNPELVTGSKIKIIGGPLMGAEGIVEKRKGQTVVTVNIELLGQSVSVEADAGDIELNE